MATTKTQEQAAIEASAGGVSRAGGWPAPWAFVIIALPTGIFQAYLQTTLPYLLRQMGYGVDRIGAMVAFVIVPMTLYFLWSPIVDFWLRRRTWMMLLAAVSAGMLIVGIALLAHHTAAAMWFLFGGYAVNLMTNSAAGGLLALTQHGEQKARAASWMQGGGLAAQALGGALLLYLSKHMPLPVTCLLAALLVTLPAAIALTIAEPAVEQGGGKAFRRTVWQMVGEIRETLFAWKSLPGILLLMAPIGSGAAQSLFAAMATDYQVNEHGVMLLNGVLGGVLTMLGAFTAVVVPARWDRRVAYASAGGVCALAGIFLSFAPMTPVSYFLGVGFYMFSVGMCFAFFLGVVMVTMGQAGRSASTRFTLLVSLGNLPIVYMTRVEGWSYARWGPHGVPAIDAAGNLCVAACVVVWLVLRRRRQAGDSSVVPVVSDRLGIALEGSAVAE